VVGTLVSAAGFVLLTGGTLFCVVGVIGLLTMPDFYNRVHAAGVVMTLGAGGVLLSTIFLASPAAGLRGLVTAAFLSLTAPMVAHVLVRAAYRTDVPLTEGTSPDELADDDPPTSSIVDHGVRSEAE
jgi:multicomponent Na+:H+ antiporter subunit G